MVHSAGVRDRLVEAVCAGLSLRRAAGLLGVSPATASRWWAQCGGMDLEVSRGRRGGLPGPVPAEVPGRRAVTGAERAVIEAGCTHGLSYAAIGQLIGRDRSVICREVRRHAAVDGRYRGAVAHRRAAESRRRPKPFRLVQNPGLCRRIEQWMDQGWSPGLIAAVLAGDEGDNHTERVSHETIYQAIYVQSRGRLRADLYRQPSLKRRHRVSRSRHRRAASPYKEAFRISQRPAEVDDRSVPGHWEGDLILGPAGRSAIGTLVERATRFTILLHLPDRHDADAVAAAMIAQMRHLPEHLRRSITWDRGTELADYARIQLALDARLFFCDPHAPWQRGTNENTVSVALVP